VIARIDRPRVSLRISVTDRCRFRCRYCMPPEGVPKCRHEDILSFEEITCIVRYLQEEFDVRKVRLTGGDPLVRRGIEDLVGMLCELGVPDLAMTTNAQELAGAAAKLRSAGLHRVNISLDSIDPGTFCHLTGGGSLAETLAGIDAALEAGLVPVKLNMVVLRGINEKEIGDLLSFAIDRGCELRFLELMPIGYGAGLFEEAFVSSDNVRRQLESRFHLSPLPAETGSSAIRYRVAEQEGGTAGVAGFISPCTEPFCNGCNRIRLTADGRLMGCLALENLRDIRSLLKDSDPHSLAVAARQALKGKRMDKRFTQHSAMAGIGG